MNDPLSGCEIAQFFGQNANPLYAGSGLNGHPGIDESCAPGYGSPYSSLVEGVVYSMWTPQHPASDGYTAVYVLVTTPLETFEFTVGHVSEILVKLGDYVKRGQIIAKEGNKGEVWSKGVHITLAMQDAGDHRGSHRHLQKRPVIRKKFAHSPFLQNAYGPYYDSEGYYYEVAMPNNGYRGCVDWNAPLFNIDLQTGDENYCVLLLQRALVREGFADWEPTGYFGSKTKAALRLYQKAHGIEPIGRCGPMTRTSLNETYKQLV